MDTMDYNYFASAGPQAYQYPLYGADGGMLHHGVSNDASGPIPVRDKF